MASPAPSSHTAAKRSRTQIMPSESPNKKRREGFALNDPNDKERALADWFTDTRLSDSSDPHWPKHSHE